MRADRCCRSTSKQSTSVKSRRKGDTKMSKQGNQHENDYKAKKQATCKPMGNSLTVPCFSVLQNNGVHEMFCMQDLAVASTHTKKIHKRFLNKFFL